MQDYQKHHKLIDRAKLTLMGHKNTTFYSSFLSMLNVIIDSNCPTAATNGLFIRYGPDFLDQISNEEILGLTLHEVEHVVNGHCDYLMYPPETYCHDKLNIAQDHYINLRLLALGYKLPDVEGIGYLADPQYKGMSSMEIYHKLPDNGPGMPQSLRDVIGGPPDGMTAEEHQRRVLNTIVKAVIMAEQANDAGSIPGNLRAELEDILSPKLPWTTILQQYLTEFQAEDYSMRRPNRRFMPGFYLPTLEGEGLGHLVMAGDVSGSMWDTIHEVWSEFKYIFETMNPITAHVMTIDTEVHLDKTYEAGDELDEWELTGGGGTEVQPVIDAIAEESPAFALIFTDGYFPMPNMDAITDTDIFWIIKDNPEFNPPKGIAIPFE